MIKNTPITIAYGDGIGPEIMTATLFILKEAGARLDLETIVIGEQQYLRGNSSGIESTAWDSLRRTKVFLKAPITTPQGGGYKSLNVTTRKTLGLYANVRPAVAYFPFIHTKHPDMDLVIVRENEEDLYAGIEHQQTVDVVQCLKLISRPGSERIVRYAFEYAKLNNRKKVTCFIKDNIMKMTDGLFHSVFNQIGQEYPDLIKESFIVDIGAAKLADHPEQFDVIVTENLYGDILSDVAAQIAGSVGIAGSSNIGADYAMFEAIHGSAPRMTNQNTANPSGLFLASIMMLQHIGQADIAELAHNAWLTTIEQGIHTKDIFSETTSKEKVGTQEFAKAVVKHLGQKPQILHPVSYNKTEAQKRHTPHPYIRPTIKRELIGVDVFINFIGNPADLAKDLQSCQTEKLSLETISARGMVTWPICHEETLLCDHNQCRFLSTSPISLKELIRLFEKMESKGIDLIKTENLYLFDGVPAFSKSQGE